MKLSNIRPVPGKLSLTLVTDMRRHLVCLPYSIQNLHRMGALLGVGRHWFHKTHYDIPVKQRQTIEQISLIVSPKSIVRLIRMSNEIPSPFKLLNENPRKPGITAKDLAKKYEVPWTENMDHEAVLYELYKKQGKTGLHYCPEWDFMAIHDNSPEFDACLCDVNTLHSNS